MHAANNPAMRQCWAAILGGCDKLSREHVVSQSVFASWCDCPTHVEGMHRTPSGHLPQSALTAKILCKKHNSALSVLDAEAGQLAEHLLHAAAGNQIGRPEIDGALIERWVFKTLINGLAAGWSDRRKWLPHEHIVRFIFGLGQVPHGCGLYSVDGSSEDLPNPQDASVTPLWAGSNPMTKKLLGGQIRINGLRLFAAFHDQVVLHLVGRPESPPRVFENEELRFVYRPAFISIGAPGSSENGLILRWQ
ncbi:hypothetical protein [Luteimonas kalidii]|uniref:Restriction endonuclease n=1 Tax=Luteimonas kalidii TaxID=3042025 RepID=A0ABT6JTC7_9GAMM|nr:hypothetical protein [Luteimonas kalidii]MDH5833948.1 hypothetical protein [Luteimonas kalidii]